MRLESARSLALLLALGTSVGGPAPAASPGQAPAQDNGSSIKTAKFSEADAAGVLVKFRQALESDNRKRLLTLFDAGKMQDYPAFRNQVAQFFDKYEAFQVFYQVKQVSNEEHVAVAVVDFEIEATPAAEAGPNVRRKAQVRLVMAWDGKQWKIVDLAPRGFFS